MSKEQSLDTAHLIALLRAAKPWIEQVGEISGYGFYRPENPHDFHPDPECCTDEEIANHRAACEAWDRGDYKREPGSVTLRDEKTLVHITRAPWGIGSYSDMQEPAKDLIAAIDCTLHAADALAQRDKEQA